MKSHVNIMDSDIAYENVIVYHGSDHILKESIYQGGKTDNDYGNGFYTTEYKDRAKSWAVLNGQHWGLTIENNRKDNNLHIK